jgi:hypothetical protein
MHNMKEDAKEMGHDAGAKNNTAEHGHLNSPTSTESPSPANPDCGQFREKQKAEPQVPPFFQ